MNISKGLVTTLVDKGALNVVKRSGISPSFLDEESQTVFNYIQRYYTDYKSVPSRGAILQAFPNFDFLDTKEPLEYFVNEIKENYRRNVLEDALFDISKSYTNDTKIAERKVRDLLQSLSITEKSFKDVDLAETALERIEQYLIKKQNPGVDGIPSEWSRVDHVCLGWHPEEFILLVGDRYIGKTWVLLWLAYQAVIYGERVLFCTKEMSTNAMSRRFDSIYCSVPFDELRRGELTETLEHRYQEKLQEFHSSNHKIIFARDGVDTISEMSQKAVELDATCIFADSVYLFDPDYNIRYSNEVQRRTEVSRACKKAAASLGIPFIASTQARREKSKKGVPSLDDIEWSNAFSQDTEVVMMLSKDEVDRELKRMGVHVLKSRDGDVTSTFINTDFEYMKFTQRDETPEPTTSIEIEEEDTIFD